MYSNLITYNGQDLLDIQCNHYLQQRDLLGHQVLQHHQILSLLGVCAPEVRDRGIYCELHKYFPLPLSLKMIFHNENIRIDRGV